MKKASFYPALALVLGAVCFALRRWQLGAEFDELRLPVPGQATALLIGGTAAALAAFVLLVLPLKACRDWESVLGKTPLPLLRAGAALYAAAAVLLVLFRSEQDESLMVFEFTTKVIPVLLVATSAAAAVGLWMAGSGGAKAGEYLVLPTLFGCVWTMSSYHNHGSDPVVLHYAWFVLGVACTAMAWQGLAALSFGRGHARRTLCLCLLSVVFSMTALADGESLADRLFLIANVLCFLALSLPMAQGLIRAEK